MDSTLKQNKEPTPLQTLEILQSQYPDRIVLLPSAIKSAAASESFKYRNKFFALMKKFASDYWDALNCHHGDVDGRLIFGGRNRNRKLIST
jgi:hypothetical protein